MWTGGSQHCLDRLVSSGTGQEGPVVHHDIAVLVGPRLELGRHGLEHPRACHASATLARWLDQF